MGSTFITIWREIIIEGTNKVMAVPIWERFLLTIKEASSYFNIGENKMHKIANEDLQSDCKFVVQNGSRTMIKRKKFEEFLNQTTSI